MRKHPILRAIPGFRGVIKRAEQVERERDKLSAMRRSWMKSFKRAGDRIQSLEAEIAALQTPTSVNAAAPEAPNTFAEVEITADLLERPRFEKFPYAGPFPWLDQPDAGVRIDAKLAAGLITANEAALCRVWSEKGYLILDRAIEPEVLDDVWAEYENAIANGVIELKQEGVSPDDPWPGRYLDVHLKVPGFCRILRHPTLLHWVELLMERVPAPFQTISSHKGSQQLPHSDSIHMTTYPIGYLSACWIAFEDIHPDSGPLVYYPGSHRLPYIFSQDVGIGEGRLSPKRKRLVSRKIRAAHPGSAGRTADRAQIFSCEERRRFILAREPDSWWFAAARFTTFPARACESLLCRRRDLLSRSERVAAKALLGHVHRGDFETVCELDVLRIFSAEDLRDLAFRRFRFVMGKKFCASSTTEFFKLFCQFARDT